VNGPVDGVWRHGYGTNLVGIPSAIIGSAAFNDQNRPLHIAGVREMNRDLFRMLNASVDPEESARFFMVYMTTMFDLAARPAAFDLAAPARADLAARSAAEQPIQRRRYRASYLRLLRGWAYDSNSPEGAVLKGWAESRFGLFPTYHRTRIGRFNSPAWARYVEEKMASRFHNNAVLSQIDLLYEFAQWTLDRRPDGRGPLRLFRGVNDFDEHPIIERLDKRRVVLRLNNIVSFTSDREVAGCFGDCILETKVPASKVLFFNSLLPEHPLKGEDEVLAIGGDYDVIATYY
jgi:NAD+---dinitrogen-reductase ADP-D-ribosyltransferase